MKRLLNTLLFLIISLSLISCSSSDADKPLKISATTWIGYTPLFYAKEKGWLSKANIKLIHVVSLSENMYLYKAGNSDAYVGTQYEHTVLKDSMPTLVPILLFDRSNGGDIIMSNVSLKTLQNSDTKIDTYLEMDSINYTILEEFIKRYNIDEKRVNYINRDQAEIASLQNISPKQHILIVTYIPYDSILSKNGFNEILSTKDSLDILVLDALYTKVEVLIQHKQQFIQLKKMIDNAINALQKDPKGFFTVVKPYIEDLSFDDFKAGLNDIEWINDKRSSELLQRMQETSFPIKDII